MNSIPVYPNRMLVVAYGFKQSPSNFSRLIKAGLPAVGLSDADVLLVTTVDNNRHECFFNERFYDLFDITPRFLEFEVLQFALGRFAHRYTGFIYFNCSVLSKHIVHSVNCTIREHLPQVVGISVPRMCGRVDSARIPNTNDDLASTEDFVSSFFLLFNQASAHVIYEVLASFPPKALVTRAARYDVSKYQSAIINRLRRVNRNYMRQSDEIVLLKANSVIVEKAISFSVSVKGEIVRAAKLSSRTVRWLEFAKNFFYKRFRVLRPFLARL
jgi:hypothetical protein